MRLEVRHLGHSGVSVSVGDVLLVFDFHKKKGYLPDFSRYRRILVFCSHRHPDHYNPDIFRWADQGTVSYVLSDDIEHVQRSVPVHVFSPGDMRTVEDVRVEAFRSNDQGVAFLAEAAGSTVFHAGDLNWWHWEGEPEEENLHMEKTFKTEVDKIRGRIIHTAFIPVDPRLKKDRYLALDYFMETVAPGLVYPIHFRNQRETLDLMAVDLSDRWYASRIRLYRE